MKDLLRKSDEKVNALAKLKKYFTSDKKNLQLESVRKS